MRKKCLVAVVLLCVSAIPRVAAAQGAGRVDVAGGYSWLRDHDAEATFTRGWFASVGADLIGPLGLVGDVSSSSESQRGPDVEFSMNMLSLMGGPRMAIHAGRVSPFAQVLFGIARSSTTYRLPGNTLG